MNTLTRNVLVGYGAFCAVNALVAYMTSNARTGRQAGQNKLLDFNDSLLPFNLLARVLPEGTGPEIPGMHLGPGAAPQSFLPGAQTVTHYDTGTTTQFSP